MRRKKILLAIRFVVLITLFTGLSSCEGPPGMDGRDGSNAEPTNWKIQEYTVRQADWQWDSDNEYYYFTFSEPSLSRFIAEEGAVIGAIRIGDTYKPLEYTAHYYDDQNGIFFSETVKFEYAPNTVRFTISASDLFDNTPITYQPPTYTFKVTMIW